MRNLPFFRNQFMTYRPLLVCLGLVLITAVVIYSFYLQIESGIKNEKYQELVIVAESKVEQMQTWQTQQQQLASVISQDVLLVDLFSSWLEKPLLVKTALLQRLQDWQKYGHFSSVSLISLDEKVGLSTQNTFILDEDDAELLENTRRTRNVSFSDWHTTNGAKSNVHLDVAIPLKRDGQLLGFVLIQSSPSHLLFSFTQSWVVPRLQSIEVVLVQQVGEELRMLRDVEQRKTREKLSIQSLDQLIQQRTKQGLVHGHEGDIPVVIAAHQIPNTAWYLLAKVKQSELFAPVHSLEKWTRALWVTFILLGGIVFFVWFSGIRSQKAAVQRQEMLIKHFEYLSKYANDFVMILDEQGRVLEANERLLDALGYTRLEFMLMRWQDFCVDEHDHAAAFHANESYFEANFRCKDGERFVVEVCNRIVENDATRCVHCIARDIRQRKLAEQVLRQQKNFTLQIIDTVPNLIYVTNVDEEILLVNEAVAKTQGCRPEDLIGLQESVLKWLQVPPALHHQCNQEVLRHHQPVNFLVCYQTEDHLLRWFHVNKVAMRQNDGVIHVLNMVIDITERKQFEEIRADIEHIGRLNIAGEMASGVAHELSQPLSACNNYLVGCLHRMNDEVWDKVKLKQAIVLAQMQAERAGVIVNHLKSIVHKQGRELVRLDINILLRDVLNLLEDELKRQQITVRFCLSELPKVRVCKVEIEQVLFNLYKNAIEAMRTVSGDRELLISTISSGENAQISVKDTGMGITAAQAQNLFRPFHSGKQDGLGLGLVICRSFVEKHAGQIWANWQQTVGAEFCFTLSMRDEL